MLTTRSFLTLPTLYISCYLAGSGYSFIYILSLYAAAIGGDMTDVGFVLFAAGASTILLVGFAGRLANITGPSLLCCFGMLCCAGGFYIISSFTQMKPSFYLTGFLVGAGWSLYYAASPMILNAIITDKERGKHISMMAAFVVLGTGSGPLLSNWCIDHNISIYKIFEIPIFLCIASSVLFLTQGWILHKDIQSVRSRWKELCNQKTKSSHIKAILAGEAKYPLIMVFLGACIFSSMMNFQVLYAESRGLEFATYYGFYMVSVVLSRFLFGGLLTRQNPMMATPYLLIAMFVGLLVMTMNHHSATLYAISAIVLGISYGLAYALIKTYAINVSAVEIRNEVLAYFTLCYFIGVYCFPVVGGYLIAQYGYDVFIGTLMLLTVIYWYIARSCANKQ